VKCAIHGEKILLLKPGGEIFGLPPKKGVSVVNPEKLKIHKIPIPSVLIEKVFVNGEKIKNFHLQNQYLSKKNIKLFFTATSFIAPERVKFRYILEGMDKKWRSLPPGKERSVEYSGLSSGDYRFRVTACNSDGVWNTKGASFIFTVKSDLSALLFVFIFGFFLLTGVTWYFLRKKGFVLKKKRYKTSTLDPETANQCIKKLTYLLEYEKVYLDEDVSLNSLSKKLSVSYHLLSQIINEKLNKNFYDLINGYRIQEAKKQLSDPKNSRKGILTIAYDVGFNTKAAFNRVFKNYTGMTPSDYRKKSEKSAK